MDNENSCTIGLGSNTPDREYQITKAIEHLCGYFNKCSVSSVYETPAINGKDPSYMNAVVHGYTGHDRDNIVKYLKEWEKESGRTPMHTAEGLITIDLDLVIWNEHIVRPKDFERLYFNKGYRELLAKGAYETM
ncbi:MAG: 2-amino-4-hydroxy-6-hydroxymethyldihydropteridine diphosphokinase [Staphylococcus sp.]|nr:2-amino-4-hydroxy-6-hydroxymethyldihydropteridine diphosphokinase [Staphylococcus sp.]